MIEQNNLKENMQFAFKNTLWALWPSGIITFLVIILNFGVDDVPRLSEVFMISLLILIPNIPFFIGSFSLKVVLQKGYSSVVSIITSIIITIFSWFLTIFLFYFFTKLLSLINWHGFSDGYTGLIAFAIAVVFLLVFFIRSIIICFSFDKLSSWESKVFSLLKAVAIMFFIYLIFEILI